MEVDDITQVNSCDVDESDSSSDGDNGEEDEKDEEYNRLVELVWNKQDKNHDSYDIQKEVLDAVLEYGDITLASYSIDIMSKCFPLAPDIWKKYIDLQALDENDETQITTLMEIYRKALFDYFSLELRQGYLTLSLHCEIEITRAAFEEAVAREGLHPLYGYRIWESYRLFESSHLSLIEEDSPEQYAQLSRLTDIIIRQLSTPLQYDEDLYGVLVNLSAAVPNLVDLEAAEKLKIDSAKLLNTYLSFEKAIDDIQEENSLKKLSIFTDYICAVQNRSDSNPKFIESLYYRATTEFCLNTNLWQQFCIFSLSQKNSDSTNSITNINNIISNALRNVPWSSEIWILKLRWEEHCNTDNEEIKATLEKALACCTSNVSHVWMTYLEFLKRKTDFMDASAVDKLRKTFALCVESLNKHWAHVDNSIEIIKFWARLEYTILKDPAKGRELWNDVLGYGTNKSEPYIWLEMAKLEELRGPDQARKIYRRAVLECGNSILTDAWLTFERLHGSLESLEKCVKICDEQSHIFSEIKILKSYQEPRKRKCNFTEDSQENYKRFKSDVKMKKSRSKNESGAQNSKLSNEPMDCGDSSNRSKNKKLKKHTEVDTKEESELSKLHISSQDKRVQHDPSKDNVTIFISNLDYTITEEQLTIALKEKANLHINEVRLVMKPNGTNKGYAYVVLSNTDEVEKALAMDRTSISGRPMYISSCHGEKEQRKHGFRYKEELEKNKLFVKGLPFDTTDKDLRELFGKYGELKDVRLVTYKNGKSKGLAFVEYCDENTASKAIIQTDNMVIGDFTISVALSAPPPRKNKSKSAADQAADSAKPSLGAGLGSTQGQLRKAKMSFIPRSVQKAVMANNGSKVEAMEQSIDETTSDIKPKTNDDFRKMLLGNK